MASPERFIKKHKYYCGYCNTHFTKNVKYRTNKLGIPYIWQSCITCEKCGNNLPKDSYLK